MHWWCAPGWGWAWRKPRWHGRTMAWRLPTPGRKCAGKAGWWRPMQLPGWPGRPGRPGWPGHSCKWHTVDGGLLLRLRLLLLSHVWRLVTSPLSTCCFSCPVRSEVLQQRHWRSRLRLDRFRLGCIFWCRRLALFLLERSTHEHDATFLVPARPSWADLVERLDNTLFDPSLHGRLTDVVVFQANKEREICFSMASLAGKGRILCQCVHHAVKPAISYCTVTYVQL